MLQLRKSQDRGHANHGWLNSKHTFSFAGYYDPKHMGFRSLRVINEDKIKGGTGFGAHPHNDMEIISYVVKGGLKHQDSMGNDTIIKPNEVQRMTAGTGVVHSEYNASPNEDAHFFQIWITPKARGQDPGYGQKSFEKELESQKLVHVISQDGKDGSISINQDADMFISRLKTGDDLTYSIRKNRGVWIQVVKGQLTINDQNVIAGDALSFENEDDLKVKATKESEIIIFDLA